MKITNSLYYYPECGMGDANTYVIKDDSNIIVDVGSADYLPYIIAGLKKDGIKPSDIKFIVNTHLHIDHSMGNDEFKKLSGARILTHPLQKKHYTTNVVETSLAFGLQAQEYKEDGLLDPAEFGKGRLKLEVIVTPGHSSDGICIYSPVEKFLVCGDLIFSENTGRVDLPGGSAEQLKRSIEMVSRLDIEYLLPGHMGIVAGAAAVRENFSFVRENVFRWL